MIRALGSYLQSILWCCELLSKFVEIPYVKKKSWGNKHNVKITVDIIVETLWSLMSDPHKRKLVGVWNEFFFGV
jgi:hypothetical protein